MGLGAIIQVNGIPAPDLMGEGQVEYVQVHEQLGETTMYTIRYAVDVEDGDLSRVNDLRIGPGSNLSILVPSGTDLFCLVKGPIFSHQIEIQNGGEGSYLDVNGGDSSLAMNRQINSSTYEGTDGDAVRMIVSSYGMIPDIGVTNGMHVQLKHNLIQRSTDLQFIRKLARRNGFKFWVTCNPLGIETAHFQRPNVVGMEETTLRINQENYNIDALSISWDVERPNLTQASQLDLSTKVALPGLVPVSPQPPMGSIPRQLFSPEVRSTLVSSPVDDVGDLLARGQGTLVEADFFIRASCQTSLHQLGTVVRAASLVKVEGAGNLHSGTYLVAGVRHQITETAHTMELELIRNAVGPGI